MRVRCPNCHDSTEVDKNAELSNIACPSCGSKFSLLGEETTPFEQAGSNTIGHFELVDQLGLGSFGSVWMARDTHLDRSVAIKIPRKGQLAPAETEQFIREARAAAQLKHPNIVTVHEVGREDGQVYIVSDYVEGLTLAEWMIGQQLTSRTAAELCVKLAEALHHAHEAGVIHRDLKPTNIILDRDNEPHVMDFGLAKREAAEVTMTMEGKVLGTPAYMSPEQAKGEAHQADRRSDVYSLGVILYELLTGHKPFRGNVRMLLQQVINEDVPSPRRLNSSVPSDLETLCLKCLEKTPEHRYPTAKSLADDLRRFLVGKPIEARAVSTPERAWRWCKRNPLVAGLTSSLAATLLVIAVISPLVAFSQARLAQDAEIAREQMRQRLYVSDMAVGLEEWEGGNFGRAVNLLKRHTPEPDEEDLRGFEWYYLWRECRRGFETPVLRHPGVVFSIAVSPNGKTLASAGRSSVILWDTDRRVQKEVLSTDDQFVWEVAFSPDGKALAAAVHDSLRLYDLTAVPTTEKKLLPGRTNRLAFSSTGKFIAAVVNNRLTLWDVDEGESTDDFFYKESWGQITKLAFSPDGATLVAHHSSGRLNLWDTATLEQIDSQVFDNAPSWSGLDFSSDGTVLAVSTGARTSLVDLATWQSRPLAENGPHNPNVAFSPDGGTLASSEYPSKVQLWDAITGELIEELKGHSAHVTSLAYSPRGDYLASAGYEGHIRLWSLPIAGEPRTLRRGNGSVFGVSFSPDGKLLATASGEGVALWDARSWQFVEELSPDGSQFVKFSPDGEMLAFNTPEGTVIWDVKLRETRDTIRRSSKVRSVAFSKDSRYLVEGRNDDDKSIALMDLLSPDKEPEMLLGHRGLVRNVTMSPDRTRFASSGDRVLIWDIVSRTPRELTHQHDDIYALAFSPDGKLLASGSHSDKIGGKTIKIWDVESGVELPSLPADGEEVGDLTFSPDGTTLVSKAGGVLNLWDVKKEVVRAKFGGLRRFLCVAFSPDGNTLVAGGSDGSVMVWRAANPEVVRHAQW